MTKSSDIVDTRTRTLLTVPAGFFGRFFFDQSFCLSNAIREITRLLLTCSSIYCGSIDRLGVCSSPSVFVHTSHPSNHHSTTHILNGSYFSKDRVCDFVLYCVRYLNDRWWVFLFKFYVVILCMSWSTRVRHPNKLSFWRWCVLIQNLTDFVSSWVF